MEDEGVALTVLCNAYDDLGTSFYKSKLIASEAWQRLSVIFIDEGDDESAWKAYQTAQRLTPNVPGVDVLEINLLIGQGDTELAQQCAQIILRKMQKRGEFEDSPMVDFLMMVAEDAEKVSQELFSPDTSSDQIDRLIKWIKKSSGRRLPIYKLDIYDFDQQAAEEDESIQINLFDDPQDHESFDNNSKKEASLIIPKSIKQLEMKWFNLMHSETAEGFPWEQTEWLNFLEENPQCFGSIEIIHDLLVGLEDWEEDELLLTKIGLPLAKRVWKIYESLPEDVMFPWGFLENRTFYRTLYFIVAILKSLGRQDEAMQYAEQLLNINPNDNLGIRGELSNYYISIKAYDEALQLAERYPKDMLLETNMAEVLSLWAFGDKKLALKKWQDVKKQNKHLKKYMTSKKIQAPELSSIGMSIGGEDAAWYYRRDCRGIWLDHPGALTWLKEN